MRGCLFFHRPDQRSINTKANPVEFCRQFGIKHSGGVWLALKKAGKLSQSAEGRPRGKATTPYTKAETEEVRRSKQFIDDLFTRFLDKKYESIFD